MKSLHDRQYVQSYIYNKVTDYNHEESTLKVTEASQVAQVPNLGQCLVNGLHLKVNTAF